VESSDSPPQARYRHLASLYDDLFPLDPDALRLVLGLLEADPPQALGGQSILDAGCGTGLLVRALAGRGYRAYGFDLDADLLAVAEARSGDRASYGSDDLRRFTVPTGLMPVRLVVSLGNTLPHLLTDADLDAFLVRSRNALSPDGQLLVQVLDYDRLEALGVPPLPVREVMGVTFERRYTVLPSGLWRFHTALTGPEGASSGAFDLRPWRRRDLESALLRTGFRVEAVWGGFDRSPPGSSLPLVLLARVA